MLVTVQEAAMRLSLDPNTLYIWHRQKRIKTVKLGRAVRIPASEVERLATKGTA